MVDQHIITVNINLKVVQSTCNEVILQLESLILTEIFPSVQKHDIF